MSFLSHFSISNPNGNFSGNEYCHNSQTKVFLTAFNIYLIFIQFFNRKLLNISIIIYEFALKN